MQQPTSWTTLCLLIWTLIVLSAVSARETTDVANLHIDIANVVPETADEDAPPTQPPSSINIPIAGIYHPHGHLHGHTRKHHHEEDKELLPRSSSSSSSITFPAPFDTSLSKNFTTKTCPDYFNKFLTDTTFTNCRAISTLLRDSAAFFHTLTSAASTSHLLDIACAVDVQSCTSTLNTWASNLLADDACGQDYAAGNPLVTSAYLDMITYEPIYRATCLQNPETKDYCFVDAVTNTSSPADYDVYLLPYGSSITSRPFPTCNACLQASLDVFSHFAEVDGQPLAESYLPSADAINGECGAGFANVRVTVGHDTRTPSSAAPFSPLLSLDRRLIFSLVSGLILLFFST